MRKQTKLVAVLSAAALLAIGASMTSFAAAAHWDQQDGEWVFVDRNGDRMTDVWKKSNGQWYYLDSDGYMAKDQVIEDDDNKYYVGADGARVTNAWVSLDNDDLLDDDSEPESIDTVWMYFDATGKALGAGVTNGEIKRLPYGDGKSDYFIFNDEGYMLSGWKRWSKKNGLDNDASDLYYLGSPNEGWARTNWHYLEVNTDVNEFEGLDEEDNYTDESWFYFKSNGKAYVDTTASYNNRTYAFDKHGRMLDLWVYSQDAVINSASDSNLTNNDASASSAKAAYYTEESGGRIGSDWILAYPSSNYDNYGDDLYYYYLDSKGKPFRANADAKLGGIGAAYRFDDDNAALTDVDTTSDVGAKIIKSQTYLFNKNGVMLTGLYYLGAETVDANRNPIDDAAKTVYRGKNAMSNGYYYFTEDDYPSSVAGQMVTNKRITIDVNGDDETYYFNKSGKAYQSTIINDYVYGTDGKLVTKGDGNTYEVVYLKDAGAKKVGDDKWVLYGKGNNNKEELISGDSKTQVLINGNGKIKKNGSVSKDLDDNKVTVSNYKVTKIETD